ncbi:hypothetical protein [Phytopseudomonas dryadis]|uniref:hypothetical protein n=1 Tax=Pseudomonadaceae TaxID=135621 RepID=UPI001037FB82|nr:MULTISPECIES: hypothetical protein [Pseudomonas]
MSELSSLDDLRRLFKEIAEAKIGDFDNGKLSVDYNCDLNEAFNKYAGLLCNSIKMLDSGKADDLIAQPALMMIRTHAISLSGFFDSIADDAEFFIKSGRWAEIPE